MKVDFLHIGLHKTASTWLQQVVFDRHPGLRVFHPATRYKNSHTVVERIYRDPTGLFDRERWWLEFERETEGLDVSGRKVGISYESLAGDMIHARDMMTVAKRCKSLFGPVKVILVLRHPVDYVSSMYQQYVQQGGELTLRQLVQDVNLPGRDIAHKLNYHELLRQQRAVYGDENLLVLPFELMRDDRSDFLRRIWEFIGVEEPVGVDMSKHVRESITLPSLHLQRLLTAAGFTKQQTRGRIRRRFEPVMKRITKSKFRTSLEQLLRFQPALADVLKDRNYRIWTGDLEKYNYHVSTAGEYEYETRIEVDSLESAAEQVFVSEPERIPLVEEEVNLIEVEDSGFQFRGRLVA